MQRRLFLYRVVGEGAVVLELAAAKDQALLVRWDALRVLDLGSAIKKNVDNMIHVEVLRLKHARAESKTEKHCAH